MKKPLHDLNLSTIWGLSTTPSHEEWLETDDKSIAILVSNLVVSQQSTQINSRQVLCGETEDWTNWIVVVHLSRVDEAFFDNLLQALRNEIILVESPLDPVMICNSLVERKPHHLQMPSVILRTTPPSYIDQSSLVWQPSKSIWWDNRGSIWIEEEKEGLHILHSILLEWCWLVNLPPKSRRISRKFTLIQVLKI